MKIAFDFNGVLDIYPNIFFPLIHLLRISGHQVILCTGNASKAFPQEFKDQFDFCIFCDGPEEEKRLTGRVAKNHVEKMKYWKAAALKKHKVDLLFDDFADVIKGTPCVRIGPETK